MKRRDAIRFFPLSLAGIAGMAQEISAGKTCMRKHCTGFSEPLALQYSKKVRKDLITAAGLHQECPSTISFLKDVVESREDKELRKNAVFWLAEQDSRETLEFLCDIIKTGLNIKKEMLVILIKILNSLNLILGIEFKDKFLFLNM